jgi:hypothetical protein
MNSGARLGLAVAAGYVLGRFHKLKWGLAVAALAGGRRLPGGPGGLVQQGAKLLASSPEFTKLTDEMKGRLVDAGKAAAAAAVSSKIDSLSESLRGRTDAMRAASAGGESAAPAGEEEDLESERDRDEDERYRDKSRTADSRREPDAEEDEGGRVPAPRRPSPRGESAAHGRARHPSRHGGEGEDARSGAGEDARSAAGTGQREDGGRSGPRSPASRTGDDIE